MTFRSTLVTGDRRKKLTQWLLAPEASTLCAILESEADLLEAKAVEVRMREPVAVIQGDEDPQAVHDQFKDAAILRLVVAEFRKIQARTDFTIHTPHVRPTAAAGAADPGTPEG